MPARRTATSPKKKGVPAAGPKTAATRTTQPATIDEYLAPLRADGVRAWYPVRRNGRLQRIAIKYLNENELAVKVRREMEAAFGRPNTAGPPPS